LFSSAAMTVQKTEAVKANAAQSSFVYIVVSFAVIGAILFGLDQGNWAGAIEKDGFMKAFCIDHGGSYDECHEPKSHPAWYTNFLSWGSSLLQLGAACGALVISPPIAGRFGRRQAMMIGSLIAICGLIVTVITGNSLVFLVARFALGVGVGIVTYALPMYISEISPPEIRGALGSSFQVMTMGGILLASLLEALPSFGYRASFSLPMYPAIILAGGIMCLPMSPRFAILKGQRQGKVEQGVENARESLKKLLGSEVAADNEISELKASLAAEQEVAPWSVLWSDRSIRKRVVLANLLQWFQQFTGVNAILSFGPTILTAAGIPISVFLAAVMYNACGVIFTIIMALVVDKAGRRKLLMLSTASSFAFMLAAAILALMMETMAGQLGDAGKAALGWGLLACLCGYMASFSMGWGAIPWLYPSEIFPMDVKEKALSTSVCSQWIANFAIAYLVPQQVALMSPSGTFFFYAACLALGFIWVGYCVPETRGLTLEDMDSVFGARSTPKEASKVDVTSVTEAAVDV